MASYENKDIHICGLPEPEILEMDTVLYQGFGGYTVTKNDELHYMGDSDQDWDSFRTLRSIEDDAEEDPEADWKVELAEPLTGAIWKRNNETKVWSVIERNQGFA